MQTVGKILTNKYLLSIVLFIIWMCFFDQRDLFNTLDQKAKLHELLAKKQYYEREIAIAEQELINLQSNSSTLEKFAREQYNMKKEGEDIYIIEDTILVNK